MIELEMSHGRRHLELSISVLRSGSTQSGGGSIVDSKAEHISLYNDRTWVCYITAVIPILKGQKRSGTPSLFFDESITGRPVTPTEIGWMRVKVHTS